MPEMEPLEDAGGEPLANNEEASLHAKNEQSARSFFALLCFFIACIFLISFINNPPGSFTGVLVLFGIFAFGLGGMYLLTPASARRSASASQLNLARPEEARESWDVASSVESSLVEDSSFETLVEEALASIPSEFREQMANLVVLLEDEADDEVLQRVGMREGYTLLGLYQGVPLTTYGHGYSMLPERITIYQHAIEAYCHGDPARIREQVRSTVLHEVAHHFGIDHAEMPIWIK